MSADVPLLEVRGLGKRMNDQAVLDEIGFVLQRGELLGMIGANGSGKSTLLRCIAGLLRPDSGDVRVEGHSVLSKPMQVRARLGYAVDPSLLPAALTGWQCLELFASARGLNEVPRETVVFAEELRLAGVLYAEVARYSLGMRQKLALCLALLGEPPLLLLDESLNGLDPLGVYAAKQKLGELVDKGKCAVILATHMLDSTQACMSRVALLDQGRLLQEWNEKELQAMRHGGQGSLEQAMIERLRES